MEEETEAGDAGYDEDETSPFLKHAADLRPLPVRVSSIALYTCSSCSFCAVAAAVPPRPEDGTFSVIVLFTIVFGCVTDYNF